MDYIAAAVSEAKRRLDDPLVVVAGDFNQWKVDGALVDFPDIHEHVSGSTRGDRCIDRSFSNLPGVSVAGTLPPLETDYDRENAARRSDHKVAFFQASIPRVQAYSVLTYQYRYYNKE